jgi:hypothetical protein
MDPASRDIPASLQGKPFASTSAVLAIGTLSEFDGDTHLTLANEDLLYESQTGMSQVFSGELETPQGQICICDIGLNPILSLRTESKRTHIQVLANDTFEPSVVGIVAKGVN